MISAWIFVPTIFLLVAAHYATFRIYEQRVQGLRDALTMRRGLLGEQDAVIGQSYNLVPGDLLKFTQHNIGVVASNAVTLTVQRM